MKTLCFLSMLFLSGSAILLEEGTEESEMTFLGSDVADHSREELSANASESEDVSESEDEDERRSLLTARNLGNHELTENMHIPEAVLDGLKVVASWANDKIGGKIPLYGHMQKLQAKEKKVLTEVYREIDPHFNALHALGSKTLAMVTFGVMTTLLSYGGFSCTGASGQYYEDLVLPLFDAARFFSTAQLGYQYGYDNMIPNPQAGSLLWSQLNGKVDVVADILSNACLAPLRDTIKGRMSNPKTANERYMRESVFQAADDLGRILQKYVTNKNYRQVCMEVTNSITIPRAPQCVETNTAMWGTNWNLIFRYPTGAHTVITGGGKGNWHIQAFRQPWLWTQWVLDMNLDFPEPSRGWIQKQWHVKCSNGRATHISIDNGKNFHEWSGFGSYYLMPGKDEVEQSSWDQREIMQSYLLMSNPSEKVIGRFR